MCGTNVAKANSLERLLHETDDADGLALTVRLRVVGYVLE